MIFSFFLRLGLPQIKHKDTSREYRYPLENNDKRSVLAMQNSHTEGASIHIVGVHFLNIVFESLLAS